MTPKPETIATDHLPKPGAFTILRGVTGDLVLRPWFDRLALYSIAHWLFPLSRGWAAALAARGSVEAFRAEIGLQDLSSASIERVLGRLARRRRVFDEASTRWQDAFFGPRHPGDPALVEAELARQAAAQNLMAGRAGLIPLRRHLPPLRWAVADPEQVQGQHGGRLSNAQAGFPAPKQPPMTLSHQVPGAYGGERWLRFASPAGFLGDDVWARVYEPRDTSNPPTLIYLHGIAMETEFWRDTVDSVSALAGRGIRIIRPEGPWHGRRRPEGWFGGEPAMARGPLGFLQLFEAWIAEIAVLIAWARQTSTGPVALGGVSLGALTGQLAATAAKYWPAAMQPDALFLVATSRNLLDIALDGSLAGALGLPDRLRAQGWSAQSLTPWLPLLEPQGDAVMAPERIVMVLGRADNLTPFTGGLALAEQWRVPQENRFFRRQGHFSVSLGLLRDPAPLERLATLLKQG